MCKIDINKDKYNKVFLIKRENALFARVYLQKKNCYYTNFRLLFNFKFIKPKPN
jgi:hypothetical protein